MAMLPTSPKQDRGGVRTATDIERKYDLAAIVGMKQAIIQAEKELTKTNKMLEEFVASTLGSLENIQSQIDGNITTWFNYGKPTADTYPTKEWITDELKKSHIGDLYYDRNTGYAYRYEVAEDETYCWEKIKDNDVVEALAIANAAKDTADDKRRVFIEQPKPPYDNGDLWFDENGEIFICQITKTASQQYEDKDFIIATKYTDDTYAKRVGEELIVVAGTVTTIKESVDEFKVSIELLKDDLKEAQTTIKANTDGIELSVKKGEIISAINMSDEEILINAERIKLEGAVKADWIDVEDLFSKEIMATGSIIGARIESLSDESQKIVIDGGEMTFYHFDRRGEGGYMQTATLYPSSVGSMEAEGAWCFESLSTAAGNDVDYMAEEIEQINSNLSNVNDCLGYTQQTDPNYVFVRNANHTRRTSILLTNNESTNVPETNGFLITFGFKTGAGDCCVQINAPFNGTPFHIRTCWYTTWREWSTFNPTV